MTERWSYSRDEEHFNGGDDCATRDEAINEAVAEGVVEPGCRFWVGRSVPPGVEAVFSVDDVLNHLSNRVADDDCSGDYGENWPVGQVEGSVAHEELDEIVGKFNDAIDEWVAKHDPPTWFKVVDVEEHRMPEPSGET